MKELKEFDLEIGDILIFEDFNYSRKKLNLHWKKDGLQGVFDYLLHYLIAWFDPGKEGENYKNIYHAGIWGNVDTNRDEKKPLYKDCVVQAGGNGISAASLKAMLKHETVMNIYVCRLKNRTLTFKEDINTSIRNFYKEKGHYSFKTAWLLAVICSLRYTKGLLHKLLVKAFYFNSIADFIVKMILKSINEYNDKNQKEMIACSPLVGMIYKNAGYELPVNVFELLNNKELPNPNFDLKGLEEELPLTSNNNNNNNNEEWPAIKETVVTPRQLMESPAIEVIGILRHQE